MHPLRADIPIWLGAEGPKNVAQTAEIADGWIPIFYTPKSAGMYQPWLDEGFARPGARRTREDFEIAATCHLQITDSQEERQRVVDALKPSIALYMGGMGAKEQNFHKNVFDRMGYDAITEEVQELFLAGKRDEATALIPDELVEEMHIVGDAGYVKERVAAWEETGVTTLLLSCRSPEEVRQIAETLPEGSAPCLCLNGLTAPHLVGGRGPRGRPGRPAHHGVGLPGSDVVPPAARADRALPRDPARQPGCRPHR